MKKVLATIALAATVLGLAASVAFGDTLVQDGFATQANGGGMITNDGVLDWGVPAQASPYNLNLRYIQDYITTFVPPNGVWVPYPFTLRVYNHDTGGLVTTDKPMTLTIHYNDAELGGRSPSTLRVVRLVDVTWVDLPSSVDTANQTVTAQINESGDYGLLSGNVPPGSTPTPAPAPAPPAPAPAAPAPAPAPAAPTNSVISGKVFYDKNGNGVMDDGDFPIAGAGVLVVSGYWHAFTRTGSDGRYSFSGLGNGNYQVNVIVGPEWAYTTPFAVTGIAISGQAGSNGSANFGMWYKMP